MSAADRKTMTNEVLRFIFKVSLFVFMVGNLLAMGLQLKVSEVVLPLKNVRFVITTLVASFAFSPALAYLLSIVIPMERPYAVGLLLLGLAPAAPFLPLVVNRGNGDLPAAAGLMLLASLGTIVIMPFGVPLVAPGMSAGVWSIAKPLVFLILIPMASGIVMKNEWSHTADWLYPYVKTITGIGTIVFLGVVLVLNFSSFVSAIGSHAFFAQLLFVPGLTVGGYLLAVGMPHGQRVVMSLGTCTRNIGAAAAIVGTGGDQKIMVMLVIATLVTVAVSFAAAAWFPRSARRGQKDSATSGKAAVAKV